MIEGKICFSDFAHTFYDAFGNRINNFVVERYEKQGNEWCLREQYSTHAGDKFVVDGKLYFRGNKDSLIPLNMDFDSQSCHACYKIVGPDRTDYVKIIGNTYLCKNDYLKLRLHRQDYSDGTSFYSLQDRAGDFRVDHGSSDLKDLVRVLQRSIEIDEECLDRLPILAESIKQTKQLIHDIEEVMSAGIVKPKESLDNKVRTAAARTADSHSTNTTSKQTENIR